jgi:hypothetical protein
LCTIPHIKYKYVYGILEDNKSKQNAILINSGFANSIVDDLESRLFSNGIFPNICLYLDELLRVAEVGADVVYEPLPLLLPEHLPPEHPRLETRARYHYYFSFYATRGGSFSQKIESTIAD